MARSWLGLAAILQLLSLCTAQAPAVEAFNPYPEGVPSGVPPAYILTNQTLRQQLDRIASTDRIVIFTTMRFGDGITDDVVAMVANFCFWLHKRQLLRHTMLLTTDDATWRLINNRGLPVYLDRVFPRRDVYIKAVKVADSYNREFDVQKHWWGMRLVELGFRALYSDSDSVVVGDVLAPFREPWDVQGLSDWFDSELLPTGQAGERHCGLYNWVREERVPLGAVLRENWHLDPSWALGGQDSALSPVCPCQSTGLWYLQPTELTVRFMRALVKRIAWDAVWEWDQTAWNDVILGFLWGMGTDGQLRYRLLPVSQYSNCGIRTARVKEGLPVDTVVVHAGAVHGSEKIKLFTDEGLWQPDFRQDVGRPYMRHGDAWLPAKFKDAAYMATMATAALVLLPVLLLGTGALRWWRHSRRQLLPKTYVTVLPTVGGNQSEANSRPRSRPTQLT